MGSGEKNLSLISVFCFAFQCFLVCIFLCFLLVSKSQIYYVSWQYQQLLLICRIVSVRDQGFELQTNNDQPSPWAQDSFFQFLDFHVTFPPFYHFC